jgi:hypothetical protein
LVEWVASAISFRKQFTTFRTRNEIYTKQAGEIYVHNIHTIVGTEWVNNLKMKSREIIEEAVPYLQSCLGWLYTENSKTVTSNSNKKQGKRKKQCTISIGDTLITGDIVKKLRRTNSDRKV